MLLLNKVLTPSFRPFYKVQLLTEDLGYFTRNSTYTPPLWLIVFREKGFIKIKLTDMFTELLLKKIETSVSPLIDEVIKKVLLPKLTDIIEVPKQEAMFKKFLLSQYQFCSIINPICLQNRPIPLMDIYVEMELMCDRFETKSYSLSYFIGQNDRLKTNIIIKDYAGVGKSTLLKYFFIEIFNKANVIPIFIELRKLTPNQDILAYLLNKINNGRSVFNKESLLKLISKGEFIFLLDGFDEISQNKKQEISSEINHFLINNVDNRFIITSRPDKGLSVFNISKYLKIVPFTKEKAYLLLRNYDKNGELSNKLIGELEKSEHKDVEEFLNNPLLISLLFTAFEYKHKIPLKKHIFYRQVYEALYENHDLSKGDYFVRQKKSELDIDDFHRMLRHLGFFTLGEVSFSKDSLIKEVLKSKEECLLDKLIVSNFIDDIETNVPLLIKEGTHYKWAHKSIQEYFIAQFILLDAGSLRTKILHKITNNEDLLIFQNILDLIFNMDYKIFRNEVIYPLVKNELRKQSEKIRVYKQMNDCQAIFLGNGIISISLFSSDYFTTIDINNKIAQYGKGFEGNIRRYDNVIHGYSLVILLINDNSHNEFLLKYAKKEKITTHIEVQTSAFCSDVLKGCTLSEIPNLLNYQDCKSIITEAQFYEISSRVIYELNLSRQVLNLDKCYKYVQKIEIEKKEEEKNKYLNIIKRAIKN